LKYLTIAGNLKDEQRGFSPNLGWIHYRTLMNIENPNERLFYEIEADKERWDVEHLKHQIKKKRPSKQCLEKRRAVDAICGAATLNIRFDTLKSQ
jgi:hypothetical protein